MSGSNTLAKYTCLLSSIYYQLDCIVPIQSLITMRETNNYMHLLFISPVNFSTISGALTPRRDGVQMTNWGIQDFDLRLFEWLHGDKL